LHSLLHHREKKRKSQEDDDDCDDSEQELMVSERKYRILLMKDAMLLEKGALMQFSWLLPHVPFLAQRAGRR
jgi:hypothetical protein